MGFYVTSFKADANNNIVEVDWQYENADGSLGNTHVLATPAGGVALSEVTESTIAGWVESQIQATAAQFDAALAIQKAESDYQSGLVRYDRESNTNTYAIYVEPVEPEITLIDEPDLPDNPYIPEETEDP